MAEVSIITAERRLIAAARQHTTTGRMAAEYKLLLDRVWAFLRQQPGLRTDGHNIAIYRGQGEGADCELGVEVVREFPSTAEVVCTDTPIGRAATATHWGAYRELGRTYKAIHQHCRANGQRVDDVCWEIYGDWNDNPAKLRTDVFCLLR